MISNYSRRWYSGVPIAAIVTISIGAFFFIRYVNKRKEHYSAYSATPLPSDWTVGDILERNDGQHFTLLSPHNDGFYSYPSDSEGNPDKDFVSRQPASNYVLTVDDWSIDSYGLKKVGHTDKVKTITKGDYSWGISGEPMIDIRMANLDERYNLFMDNAPKRLKTKYKRQEDINYHQENAVMVNNFAYEWDAPTVSEISEPLVAFGEPGKGPYSPYGICRSSVTTTDDPSPLSKDLLSPVKKMIKAKNDGDDKAIKKADADIYSVLHKHGSKLKKGVIPFGFTKEEKEEPMLLAKRISCIADIKEDMS